jgi:AGCS family alanine or glycine:cation symporter
MLSWSYYGLQGWKYLFGKGKAADISYKILFLFFVVVGASSSLNSVIDFTNWGLCFEKAHISYLY